MARILDFWQPVGNVYDQNGLFDGCALEDRLLVKVDRNEDGRILAVVGLPFADTAGLEAEFNAGSATTVLQAAVTAKLPDVSWPVEPLTQTQRDVVDIQIMES